MAGSKLRVGAMNLLDIIAATEAKEKAIATVATNTNPDWWQACYNTIATTTNTFTTDDIWQALEDQSLPTPHEPRAMVQYYATPQLTD